MRLKNRILFCIASLFFGATAYSFPEMVRHGYPQCGACHVSVAGGGVLNAYGRELSRELLSMQWAKSEQESQFAYGLLGQSKYLDLMTLYREGYLYQKTEPVKTSKFIFMQADLELALHTEDNKWTVVGTIGRQDPPKDTVDVKTSDFLIYRRHYLALRPHENLSLRVGKFYPAFGIHTPDHVIATKRDLAFDEGMENYNIEAAWLHERFEVFLTGLLGRIDLARDQQEKGFALTPSFNFNERNKVGLSFLYGDKVASTRQVVGLWGILGFGRRAFLLSEIDFQQSTLKNSSVKTKGLVNYQRLDYELVQGWHVYLTQDFAQTDRSQIFSMHNSYGIGTQIFPRPHFELNLSWQKMRIAALSPKFNDYIWVMLQFYL